VSELHTSAFNVDPLYVTASASGSAGQLSRLLLLNLPPCEPSVSFIDETRDNRATRLQWRQEWRAAETPDGRNTRFRATYVLPHSRSSL